MLKIKLVLLWVVSEERKTSCGDPLIMRNFPNWDMQAVMPKLHVCEKLGLLPILYVEMYHTPCINWQCILQTVEMQVVKA